MEIKTEIKLSIKEDSRTRLSHQALGMQQAGIQWGGKAEAGRQLREKSLPLPPRDRQGPRGRRRGSPPAHSPPGAPGGKGMVKGSAAEQSIFCFLKPRTL